MLSLIVMEKELFNVADSSCQSCKLHKTCRSVCVPGRFYNLKQAQIFLVGEAPGEQEDKLGLTFVGKSGQFLQDTIIALKMEQYCYLTNVVKCRPPKNRAPEPGEIVACQNYIKKEFRLLRPLCVVLLGKTAREALGFTQMEVGQSTYSTNSFGTFYVRATWHPSYVLRCGKGSAQQEFESALKWAKKFMMMR